jgi:lysophospholipase L1-like esterase
LFLLAFTKNNKKSPGRESMEIKSCSKRRDLLSALMIMALSTSSFASTLNQNVSWTVDRAGTTAKYRVVAYGDSIYAGYNGSISNAARYSAPTIQAEYLSALWNADVESIRRAKSGAIASDVYQNKIVNERSYMQAASTRVVTFEMCGNDGLQARTAFKKQTGTCNYNVIDTAVNNCKTYVAAAMDYINANANPNVRLKVIANVYYPGYNADNVQSTCRDASTGATVKLQDRLLPAIGKMNYWMCEYARQKGFQCADSFAEYMGADTDTNGDGQIDANALRYLSGDTEAAYLTRITSTLRSTLRDANTKFVSTTSSYDYIQSDDTHPTYTGGTVSAGFGGGSTGSGAPRYTSFSGGKSPIWNQFGHDRMGWSLSTYNPATPAPSAATSSATATRDVALADDGVSDEAANARSNDANDIARYVRPGDPMPSMGELISALLASGESEGLAAFNPPGTSPLLRGLLVPEDFKLPAGYVRHYQTTDEGVALAAILMFAPDSQMIDANGRRMAIPQDRVVPVELAPRGLPIQFIDIPTSQ